MAMNLPETDSEDELPEAWESKISQDNYVFYVKYVIFRVFSKKLDVKKSYL